MGETKQAENCFDATVGFCLHPTPTPCAPILTFVGKEKLPLQTHLPCAGHLAELCPPITPSLSPMSPETGAYGEHWFPSRLLEVGSQV